jgi:hypothetical protein
LSEAVQRNRDGCHDIYSSPEGKESNWIQTIPGKRWFAILRMYGPVEPWLDWSRVPRHNGVALRVVRRSGP